MEIFDEVVELSDMGFELYYLIVEVFEVLIYTLIAEVFEEIRTMISEAWIELYTVIVELCMVKIEPSEPVGELFEESDEPYMVRVEPSEPVGELFVKSLIAFLNLKTQQPLFFAYPLDSNHSL